MIYVGIVIIALAICAYVQWVDYPRSVLKLRSAEVLHDMARIENTLYELREAAVKQHLEDILHNPSIIHTLSYYDSGTLQALREAIEDATDELLMIQSYEQAVMLQEDNDDNT